MSMKITTRSLGLAPLCLLVVFVLVMLRLLPFSFDAQPACGFNKNSSATAWLLCNLNLSVIRLCLFCYLCVISVYLPTQCKIYFLPSPVGSMIIFFSSVVTLYSIISLLCPVTIHISPLLHVLLCLVTCWPNTCAIFLQIINE